MKNTLINAGFIVEEIEEGILLISLNRKVYVDEIQAIFDWTLEDFQVWQNGDKVSLITGFED